MANFFGDFKWEKLFTEMTRRDFIITSLAAGAVTCANYQIMR